MISDFKVKSGNAIYSNSASLHVEVPKFKGANGVFSLGKNGYSLSNIEI